MKELLFKDNKLFTIIAYSAIFLYIFIICYFVIWNKKICIHFYEFIIIPLFLCITLSIATIEIFDKKRKNKPPKSRFKIRNNAKMFLVLMSFFIIYLFYVAIFQVCIEFSFIAIPLLISSISFSFDTLKQKIDNIEFDYNENCMYLNSEKILLNEIKEYSRELIGYSIKYTLYLVDERNISCIQSFESYIDFEKSLLKNLHYLKINERVINE